MVFGKLQISPMTPILVDLLMRPVVQLSQYLASDPDKEFKTSTSKQYSDADLILMETLPITVQVQVQMF